MGTSPIHILDILQVFPEPLWAIDSIVPSSRPRLLSSTFFRFVIYCHVTLWYVRRRRCYMKQAPVNMYAYADPFFKAVAVLSTLSPPHWFYLRFLAKRVFCVCSFCLISLGPCLNMGCEGILKLDVEQCRTQIFQVVIFLWFTNRNLVTVSHFPFGSVCSNNLNFSFWLVITNF